MFKILIGFDPKTRQLHLQSDAANPLVTIVALKAALDIAHQEAIAALSGPKVEVAPAGIEINVPAPTPHG